MNPSLQRSRRMSSLRTAEEEIGLLQTEGLCQCPEGEGAGGVDTLCANMLRRVTHVLSWLSLMEYCSQIARSRL